MKKKNIFITIGVIVLILIGVVSFLLIDKDDKKDSNNKVNEDAKKFSAEYKTIDEDNVFVYRDIDEIIRIMEKGTGVVYLGFPECPWCGAYVKYLNEVAKEVGIEKIYYYNILNDRKDETEEYKKILDILGDNLQNDEEGNPRVYVPNVSFHIDGEVIGNDCETSLDTHNLEKPEDYWTDEEVKDLKETLTKYMEKIYLELNLCTDCNK